jgi:hypothetical protein
VLTGKVMVPGRTRYLKDIRHTACSICAHQCKDAAGANSSETCTGLQTTSIPASRLKCCVLDVPILIVACREMTSGESGVRAATSSLLRSWCKQQNRCNSDQDTKELAYAGRENCISMVFSTCSLSPRFAIIQPGEVCRHPNRLSGGRM